MVEKDDVVYQDFKQQAQRVALFDLDGTILPWDTQKIFCQFVVRSQPWRRFFLLVYLPLLPFFCVLGSGGLKRVFLSFLWGMHPEEIRKLSRDFAALLFPHHAYPKMLEVIQQHKQAGDLLILVSASPDCYVQEVGALLGFDMSLGTEMEWQDKMPLFPDLENNKGARKVARLDVLFHGLARDAEGKLLHSYGYSDSCADLPMLAICKEVSVVNPNKKLKALALLNDWQIHYFARPWKNTLHRMWLRALFLLTDNCGLK